MLTISGRRALNRSLQSLIKHNESTVTVLEQLVEDLHEHPLLVPYQMINHERFEDLVWGIIKIMDSKNLHSPSVAGNAAYVIGAIIDTDVGKNRVFRLFADPSKLESHKYVLPNLTAIIECDDKKASVNASGTIAVIVGTEAGRTWALKQPSFDWVLHVLSKSVTSDNAVSASNCSLAIARICVVEEGCSRILNFRNARFILTQLIKSLGVDKEGVGMNSAFALAHLCQHETGLRLLLSLDESPEMVSSLVTMLCSSDEGCSKNACFALRNMATNTLGQKMLINCPDIDRILQTLSMLLMSRDEEIAKFAAVGLRYLASEKDGYLQQKAHPMVKPNLRRVLSNPGISHAYRKEAIKTLQNLLLPTPEKPVLQVLGAHAIKASWEDIAAKSGLDVNYGLYVDDEIVYEGPQTSFVVSGLEEVTEYVFKLRAWTDEDEESGVSETVKATTFRAVSRAPRGLRAVSITASQIKFIWSPPERVYGMLNGYKVREIGRDITYEPVSTYHIAGNLKPDTEYTFEVSAVTKRGEGESAKLTVRTLRHGQEGTISGSFGETYLLTSLGSSANHKTNISSNQIQNKPKRSCLVIKIVFCRSSTY
ncbi:uncharacterized protein LOC135689776 [Rhopilema esculentum]|uniref:uncharacterized protein LOC135689776 n=1 Tax=Rhopilema esculentum TaxID=499914 RepID=UPI0031D0BB89